MITLTYAVVTILAIAVMRTTGMWGYNEFKDQGLVVLTSLLAIVLLFTGIPTLNTASTVLTCFVAYGWASCLWSDYAIGSLEDMPRWTALAGFFVACQLSEPLSILIATFSAGVLMAIYGLYQQAAKRDPFDNELTKRFKKFPTKPRTQAFLGNTNYFGAYMVPNFFIGLYLTLNLSLWFGIPTVLIGLGVFYSRARAAWLSTMIGLCILEPMLIPVCGLVCFLAKRHFNRAYGHMEYARILWARIAWALFKDKPIFGWGPRVFRRKIFRVQAHLNKSDPNILGTLEKRGKYTNNMGKRCHNDMLETFLEFGIFGGAIFVLFLGLVGMGAWGFDHVLFAGIAATLINSMFFYVIRLTPTALPFFAMAGIVTAGPMATVILPLQYAIPLAVVIGVLAYKTAIVPYVGSRFLYLSQISLDEETGYQYAMKALQWSPYRTMVITQACLHMLKRDAPVAMDLITKVNHHFDGEKLEWATLNLYGRVAYANSALWVARAALITSIHLNPAYVDSYRGLQEVNQRLENVKRLHKKKNTKRQKTKINRAVR